MSTQDLIAERFEVIGRPLVGGMGVVHVCFDHKNDRAVALKTFRPELLSNRAARDRFLREGHVWVELGQHPHIVRAFEVLHLEGGRGAYLVLELVAKEEGRRDASLRSYLDGRRLPVFDALALAIQIVRGLDHATARMPGFVHRDLKPENVLVGPDQLATCVPRLRVTDFGLAKVLEEELPTDDAQAEDGESLRRTRLTRGAVGTPLYMAPEQWEGRVSGVATDVYALGCIVQEMLTGRSAAPGRSIRELERAHRDGKLETLGDETPEELRSFVARCLAIQPEDRYASWQEVGAALDVLCVKLAARALPVTEVGPEPVRADRLRAAWSSNELGYAYLDIGKLDVARGYFERALEAGRREGDHRLKEAALSGLGTAYGQLGDLRRAINFFEQCLATAREEGDRVAEGKTLGNLGYTYIKVGDFHRAVDYLEQDLAIAREARDRAGEGATLCNLGIAYSALGDVRRSIGCFEQLLTIARETGDRAREGRALTNIGNAHVTLGEVRRGIGYLEQDLVITRDLGDRVGEGTTLGSLGIAYGRLGDVRRWISYMEQSLTIARETGDRISEGKALGNLGGAYLQLGDDSRSIGYFEEVRAIAGETGDRFVLAASSLGLAQLLAARGDLARPLALAKEAAQHFEAMGSPHAALARELVARLAQNQR